MNRCPFCATDKDMALIPGGILYEDGLVSAYHSYQKHVSNYLGQLLLKTKRHVPGLAELTETEGQALGLTVARLSKALKACTGAEKVYAEASYLPLVILGRRKSSGAGKSATGLLYLKEAPEKSLPCARGSVLIFPFETMSEHIHL